MTRPVSVILPGTLSGPFFPRNVWSTYQQKLLISSLETRFSKPIAIYPEPRYHITGQIGCRVHL